MVHIPHIELELLRPADGIAAVALCPSADTRAHLMPAHLLLGIQGEVLGQERTWAYECHVALEDVDELGELVDGGGADEAAYLGKAVGIGEEVALGIALVSHRLELNHLENLAMQSRSLLIEQGSRPFIGNGEPNVDHKQYRPDDQQCD